MKSRLLHLLGWLLAAATIFVPVRRARAQTTQPTTGPTSQPAPAYVRSYVGENSTDPTNYDRGQVYINCAKTAAPYEQLQGGPPLVLRPDGYPAGPAQQVIFTKGTARWNGVYRFSCRGRVGSLATPKGGWPASVRNLAYDAAADLTTAEIVVNAAPGSTPQLKLLFDQVAPGGFWDVKILRPGYADDSAVVTDEYVALLQRMGCGTFRGMCWERINGSEVRTWDERTKPSDAVYPTKLRGQVRGAPLEDLITVCNRVGCDLWVNIPHMADDDYVGRAADLILEKLDPRLGVREQYSNELWNTAGGFDQTVWCMDQADRSIAAGDKRFDSNPTVRRTRGLQWAAMRAGRVGQIFRQRFEAKGQGHRLTVELDGQAADPTVLDVKIGWLKDNVGGGSLRAAGVDAICVAPYFGSDKYWDVRDDLTVDSYLAPGYDLDVETGSKDATGKKLTERRHFDGVYLQDKALGVLGGAKLTRFFLQGKENSVACDAYEGGKGLGDPDSVKAHSTAAKLAVGFDPRFEPICSEYLRDWSRLGGGVFVWFVPVSDSPYGATDEPTRLDVPAVRAIAAAAAEVPLPFPPKPAPPVDPKDERIKSLEAERDDLKATIDAVRHLVGAP